MTPPPPPPHQIGNEAGTGTGARRPLAATAVVVGVFSLQPRPDTARYRRLHSGVIAPLLQLQKPFRLAASQVMHGNLLTDRPTAFDLAKRGANCTQFPQASRRIRWHGLALVP